MTCLFSSGLGLEHSWDFLRTCLAKHATDRHANGAVNGRVGRLRTKVDHGAEVGVTAGVVVLLIQAVVEAAVEVRMCIIYCFRRLCFYRSSVICCVTHKGTS
jgi:hypothetical protein